MTNEDKVKKIYPNATCPNRDINVFHVEALNSHGNTITIGKGTTILDAWDNAWQLTEIALLNNFYRIKVAAEELLEYNWEKEKDDYYEQVDLHENDEEPDFKPENHIFSTLCNLRDWIELPLDIEHLIELLHKPTNTP